MSRRGSSPTYGKTPKRRAAFVRPRSWQRLRWASTRAQKRKAPANTRTRRPSRWIPPASCRSTLEDVRDFGAVAT
eukprot:2413853-Prymnesium_polylepis.1